MSALKSIQKHFDIVYLMSSNPIDILNLKREKDFIINNFNESDCKFVFLAGHESFIDSGQLKKKPLLIFTDHYCQGGEVCTQRFGQFLMATKG